MTNILQKALLITFSIAVAGSSMPAGAHGPTPPLLLAYMDLVVKDCKEGFPDLRPGLDAAIQKGESKKPLLWSALRTNPEYLQHYRDGEKESSGPEALAEFAVRGREICEMELPEFMDLLLSQQFMDAAEGWLQDQALHQERQDR